MKSIVATLIVLLSVATELRGDFMQWTEFSAILKPSEISGVGVFTTHELKAGTQVLPKFNPKIRKTNAIPHEFIHFCIFLNEEECLCPEQFDQMEIGWYLNHSNFPNVERKSDGNLYALRDIGAGEEILMDYNQFDEPENLKDPCCEK